eukprot:TRINITY_DN25782_c0_g1_i1.p2 TRINITY_DN25782_c0_g1~~TRINITY_DN25782_c0_g1_i1.p2  ORF type:complete len:244 (-),score=70.63 TRINITY_DN25782_c0_g1_i1:444-1175(-)
MYHFGRCCVCLLGATVGLGKEEEVKINWMDGWRQSIQECTEKDATLFKSKSGKPITRRLDQMGKLISEKLVKEEMDRRMEQRKKQQKKKAAGREKPGKKLSKDERKKRELASALGGVFEKSLDTAEQDKKEREELMNSFMGTSMQMITGVIRNTKLPPNTEVTHKEWCDIVFRAGQDNPWTREMEAEDEEKERKKQEDRDYQRRDDREARKEIKIADDEEELRADGNTGVWQAAEAQDRNQEL